MAKWNETKPMPIIVAKFAHLSTCLTTVVATIEILETQVGGAIARAILPWPRVLLCSASRWLRLSLKQLESDGYIEGFDIFKYFGHIVKIATWVALSASNCLVVGENLEGLFAQEGYEAVADPEGVPWNPSFEGLSSKILCGKRSM